MAEESVSTVAATRRGTYALNTRERYPPKYFLTFVGEPAQANGQRSHDEVVHR